MGTNMRGEGERSNHGWVGVLTFFTGRNEIIGFDFVEVNPVLDVGTGVTSYIGAHLVVECLGLVCEQAWWKARVG